MERGFAKEFDMIVGSPESVFRCEIDADTTRCRATILGMLWIQSKVTKDAYRGNPHVGTTYGCREVGHHSDPCAVSDRVGLGWSRDGGQSAKDLGLCTPGCLMAGHTRFIGLFALPLSLSCIHT